MIKLSRTFLSTLSRPTKKVRLGSTQLKPQERQMIRGRIMASIKQQDGEIDITDGLHQPNTMTENKIISDGE